MGLVKDLTSNELCLSGSFGHKISEILKPNKSEFCALFIKAMYSFNGYGIIVDDNNFVTIDGRFEDSVRSELLTKFNNYLNKKVEQVEDQQYREKIIEIANLDLSRNSKYHIFNIELLCSAAAVKKERFDILYLLMKEKNFYDYAEKNYEYYLFTIFDVNTYENAMEVFDMINEESSDIVYDEDMGYKLVIKKLPYNSLDKQLKERLEKSEIEKINKHLDLIKIV